jgi:hypothetical protein
MSRRERLETALSVIVLVFVLLIVGLFFGSSWLAKNVYSYEVITEETIEEAYQHPTGEKINTFVCYTTTYGECYHAESCGYLWSSSHQTTVYDAELRGYSSCSRCSPTEKTVIEITETRYRDVKLERVEEKHPTLELFIIGFFPLLAVFLILFISIKRKLKEA